MGKKDAEVKEKIKTEEEKIRERFKTEAAQELGLFQKVRQFGWDKLTAQETGRIGAIVKKKLKDTRRSKKV